MTLNRRPRLRIISLLLLVLVARALVPSGFMPAGDGSAALTICPDGMVMSSDPADAGRTESHVDHCPFGSAPFAAPIPQLPITPVLAAAISVPGPSFSSWASITRIARSHQARAPPASSTVT